MGANNLAGERQRGDDEIAALRRADVEPDRAQRVRQHCAVQRTQQRVERGGRTLACHLSLDERARRLTRDARSFSPPQPLPPRKKPSPATRASPPPRPQRARAEREEQPSAQDHIKRRAPAWLRAYIAGTPSKAAAALASPPPSGEARQRSSASATPSWSGVGAQTVACWHTGSRERRNTPTSYCANSRAVTRVEGVGAAQPTAARWPRPPLWPPPPL